MRLRAALVAIFYKRELSPVFFAVRLSARIPGHDQSAKPAVTWSSYVTVFLLCRIIGSADMVIPNVMPCSTNSTINTKKFIRSPLRFGFLSSFGHSSTTSPPPPPPPSPFFDMFRGNRFLANADPVTQRLTAERDEITRLSEELRVAIGRRLDLIFTLL